MTSRQVLFLTLTILVISTALPLWSVSGQPIEERKSGNPLVPVERSDEELLVLEVRLGRYILSDGIIGYIHRGGVLLSLEDMARVLEFPISVKLATGQADGWFINKNRRFSLDIARGEVVLKGKAQSYERSLVELHRDGIYIDATLFGQWFPVDLEYDLARLIVNVVSREPLPLEKRLEREKARQLLGRGAGAAPVYPRVNARYSFFDWPFIDVNLNLLKRSPETGGREGRYNGLVSGDLLFMSSVFFLSGIDEDSLTDVRLTMGRSDPDGTLLGPLQAQTFKLGDVFSPQIPLISISRVGRGAEISNFPLSRPSEFDRTTLQGELPLEWEVELYRNEVLLDFRTSRADGRYEFIDVPLLYGLNVLRLIFYGPQGQRREEVRRILVGRGLVRPGKLHYRLAASQQDKYLFRLERNVLDEELVGQGRFLAEYEWGISRKFSVSGSGVSLPFVAGRRYYGSLGLRAAMLRAFTRIDISREYNGGTALQVATQFNFLGHNVLAEHGQYFDFVSERIREQIDPIVSLTKLRFDGVLPLWPLPRIPFGFSGNIERRQSGRVRYDGSNRLSLFLRGVSFSNTLTGSLNRGGGTVTTTRVNGSFLLSGRLKRLSLRSQLSYEPPPNHRFLSVALTSDYAIPNSFGTHFTVNKQLQDDRRTSYSVGINRTFDAFLMGLDGRYENDANYSIRLSISFSLGLKPRSNSLHLSSRRMGNNGAASVRVFLDKNLDGIYDLGDQPLEGVRLRHGGRTSKPTDKKGIVYIPNLSSYRPTDITIEIGSLEDPFWIPINEGVTIVPRPGKSISIEFPVIVTGEVDGTVFLRRGTSVKGVSNVMLELVNGKGEILMHTKTAFDGFYLFMMVPPGSYVVRVSPEQIKRLNLESPHVREVVIKGDGTIVSGVDIILERSSEE